MGEFARHLVDLSKVGQIDEFAAVFEVIERLQVEGDSFVKEAAVIGALETIQNVDESMDLQKFVPLLKPESGKAWEALILFWGNKTDKSDLS